MSISTTTLGSGPDQLQLQISEDAYQGDAQFSVSVDGTLLGGPLTAIASHAAGATQLFDINGSFGSGLHDVKIQYLNDAWNGPTQDRNLYVDGVSLNGTSAVTPTTALFNNASTDFAIPGTGAASDTLVLGLSEDAWNGHAQATLSVDGKVLNGPFDVTASHGQGQSQSLSLSGNFGSGAHTVSVAFANDAWGGMGNDRNLYLDSVDFNGTRVTGASGALFNNGTLTFNIPAAGSANSIPTPAPSPATIKAAVTATTAALPALISPDTIYVGSGSQYTTIQQGIQAAEARGSHNVAVNPGNYAENDFLGAADQGLTISATAPGVTLTGSFSIATTSAITIQGLGFKGNGSNIAISALNSQNVKILGNSFAGTGEAVVLDGTGGSAVSNNWMTNTSQSAIEEINGSNGNTVDSNLIDGDNAPDTKGAIWLHGSNNGVISHNQITNTTGAGISLSDFYGPGTTATQNNNNIVEYNSLNNVDTQSMDSGAIYILGRSQDPLTNNQVKMNFIGATGHIGAQAIGVYLDDNASGVTVSQNIVQASPGLSAAYQIHGGSNDTISGNIFDMGSGQSASLPVYGLHQADEANTQPVGSFASLQNDVVTGNIFTSESTSPPNPGFADLTNGVGNVSVSGNDFWSFNGAQLHATGTGAGGDTKPSFAAPAGQPSQTLSAYGSWSGAGINFGAIDTSLIGLAPGGSHPYNIAA